MYAHRVDVLDRADDDHVVGVVAHHLQLELPPADHGLVEQNLPDRRGLEPDRDDPLELTGAARDAAAATAEREGGTHDAWQSQPAIAPGSSLESFPRLGEAPGDSTVRHRQAGGGHGGSEQVTILGAGDRLVVGADQLDAEARERAVVVERL